MEGASVVNFNKLLAEMKRRTVEVSPIPSKPKAEKKEILVLDSIQERSFEELLELQLERFGRVKSPRSYALPFLKMQARRHHKKRKRNKQSRKERRFDDYEE